MIKQVEVGQFYVAGIAVRTTNEREMSGDAVIGKHWERFFAEHILGKIPNRTDSSIYAVYTDYEGDQNGAYTLLLGAKLGGRLPLPPGMVATAIPAGKYAVVTSDPGPVVEAVVGAWKKIWSTPPNELGGDRAFKADFELYDERATDPRNSVVDVYVGLK